ncbi:MAG: hypothetical protein HY269_06350, partial [Deltaproteobacteria bacterium]|nr:hypothetical protein [Deltaproteobacteria bacterium]
MTRALAALLFLLFAAPAWAVDISPKVQAQLVAEHDTVVPGGTVTIALVEKIKPGWHTYWINPGDAGAPTSIAWELPVGWQAAAIRWPYPKRLPIGQLMDYGYEDSVWLLSDISVPEDAKIGDAFLIKANANWLVCKEICIPEQSVPRRQSARCLPPVTRSCAGQAASRRLLPARTRLHIQSGRATVRLRELRDRLAFGPGSKGEVRHNVGWRRCVHLRRWLCRSLRCACDLRCGPPRFLCLQDVHTRHLARAAVRIDRWLDPERHALRVASARYEGAVARQPKWRRKIRRAHRRFGVRHRRHRQLHRI